VIYEELVVLRPLQVGLARDIDGLCLVAVEVVRWYALLELLYLLNLAQGLSDCMLIAHAALFVPNQAQLSIRTPLLLKGLIKHIHQHHQENPLNLFQTHPLSPESRHKPPLLLLTHTKVHII
jgi:hypothetical protein